ncbi:hypothetical protein [Kitasatospora aureofaciens]|uniref:hypothetical protein n=1 Tax=Kitasatospora aureofaciens TaxID=1894 RepID=UPI00381D9C2D
MPGVVSANHNGGGRPSATSPVTGSRQTLEAAQAATAAAEAFGLDGPVGQRLARGGTFLERVIQDMMESADRWRALLT